MKNLALLVFVCFLAACSTMTPPQQRMPFPEHEYQSLAKSGSAVVKGQAFLKTRGGDVKGSITRF
jgi:hypothetical protein